MEVAVAETPFFTGQRKRKWAINRMKMASFDIRNGYQVSGIAERMMNRDPTGKNCYEKESYRKLSSSRIAAASDQ